jgi:ATP dependent DNA ligase domain
MLLSATAELPSRPEWALEVKWDGMRAQLGFDGRRVGVRSRSGRDSTGEFPEFGASADALDDQVLVDGELVCLDQKGLPDFERLRARTPGAVTSARVTAPATLIIFDVLHAGRSTRRLPYRERRAHLEALELEGAAWRTPRTFAVDEALAAVTRERHLEGVVAKRRDPPYQPGHRGEEWLKHKHRHREPLSLNAWWPGDRPARRAARGAAWTITVTCATPAVCASPSSAITAPGCARPYSASSNHSRAGPPSAASTPYWPLTSTTTAAPEAHCATRCSAASRSQQARRVGPVILADFD